MAVYTEELATEFNYPHIDIYKRYNDGELCAYKVLAQDGYVFYDTTANDTEPDPITGDLVSVTYYYTIRLCPVTADMENLTLVAVPRDSVNENYIFGGGDNSDHEVM